MNVIFVLWLRELKRYMRSRAQIIGSHGGEQVIYDAGEKKIVASLGGKDVFPNPEGDIALSADGSWFVNSHREGEYHHYTFLNMKTRTVVITSRKR